MEEIAMRSVRILRSPATSKRPAPTAKIPILIVIRYGLRPWLEVHGPRDQVQVLFAETLRVPDPTLEDDKINEEILRLRLPRRWRDVIDGVPIASWTLAGRTPYEDVCIQTDLEILAALQHTGDKPGCSK